ncbi:hypothetical protein [Cloacibacterium normanense]|uniref:Uncharacterized protein n=1 Tax=Cloacibacterium normanense TaxID=237258 RepID=A0A1E5UAH7_9FLAO|nr:hypothetical protein [Cloacibacterium normanense]AZI68919.1 hypothetical protein EB819_03120 [Cloacibacterium normanense]AZI69649.1 hypothetical protein EB819_07040 [Cloacibacterium normanense]OEL09954.1 hypothetical protein BHF72_0996 [Cloacibacterium normanense]SDO93855.1 hypothetical protein SAMN04489756_13310 [Cloacibacterium normanense]
MQRISQIIGISIGVILILTVLVSTLFKQNINVPEIKSEKGKIIHIERFKPKNKWSISYNIRLQNDNRLLKILPEYYECFDFENFKREITIGQEIEFKIDPNKGIRTTENIVSITKDGKEYLNINCINQKIKKDKIQLPLILFGLISLLTLIYFVQKRIKNKNCA